MAISDDRFLVSRFNTKENRYKGTVSVKPNHKWIIDKFFFQFIPAQASNQEVLSIACDEKLNLTLCRNLVVFYQSNNIDRTIINSLKFHLTQNFIHNWGEYDNYIYLLNPGNERHLTVNTCSVDDIIDWSYECRTEELAAKKTSDILFIIAKKPRQREDLYKETLINLVNSRANSREYYVTVIIYLGTENEFNNNQYNNNFLVPMIEYRKLGNYQTSTQTSENKSYTNIMSDEEAF